MVPVKRMGHATFMTPDLDRMVDYYGQVLGLVVVARERDTAWLACPGDYHSVVLHQGDAGAATRLSLQVAADADLNALLHHMRAHDLSPKMLSDSEPDLPQAISVHDPSGLELQIFRMRDVTPKERVKSGIIPRKLGHTAFFSPDVQGTVDFYVNVLGFKVSDWIGDFFAFLRCNSDHHTVNIFRGPGPRMHHHAFELTDWAHIKDACDLLNKHAMHLTWGPGRHGPGHNIYTYHNNPDGISVELFCELDQMVDEALGYFEPRPWHRDVPLRPKVWTPGLLTTNFWGVPRPENVH
jgi:catechol 2,3-dioxygenase-like lactoylglutathione lyase family enzyme